MIALLFLIFVLPIALAIGAMTYFTIVIVNTIYEVGKAIYEGKEPVNKYKH